jgi:hypothetical protein
MEQAIVNHIACDLKTTPRVSLSEIWYNWGFVEVAIGRSGPQRTLATATPTYLQSFLAIEASAPR